jgi:hypothetical protein
MLLAMSLGPSSATAPAKDAGNYLSTQIKGRRTKTNQGGP